MPRPLTEHESQEFLAEPHVGVLSVASDNARPPLTIPIWYHYQPGGNLTFFTGSHGQKARKTRLIERAGVVSFCVQHATPPYKFVTVEGSLVSAIRSPSAEQMQAIVSRYLPPEYAQGFVDAELAVPPDKSELVLFTTRPDRWITFDFSE